MPSVLPRYTCCTNSTNVVLNKRLQKYENNRKSIGHFGKYHNTFCLSPKNLHKHCFQFLLGLTLVPKENENNAYAKFGGTNKEYYGIFRSGLWKLKNSGPLSGQFTISPHTLSLFSSVRLVKSTAVWRCSGFRWMQIRKLWFKTQHFDTAIQYFHHPLIKVWLSRRPCWCTEK